jgi:transposase
MRLLHQLKAPPVEKPRVIGSDDWAFRKGRDYGTLIIDYETGKPIALLSKRDQETVKAWLEKHPTIEIVTRGRSGEYREASTQALPDAVQVADRWHLLGNLREVIERHLSRHYQTVRQLVAQSAEGEGKQIHDNIGAKCRRYAPGAARETLHAARTEEREALFAAVKARLAQGAYTTDVAKEFNLSAKRSVNGSIVRPYPQMPEGDSSKNA